MKIRKFWSVGLVVLLLAFGIAQPLQIAAQDEGTSPLTETFDATIATDWVSFVYELVRDETVNAPAASRIYAYTGVALFEAVVPGMPNNFSVGGQMDGLAMLPYPEEGLVYDWPAVANGSLSTVIHALFSESEADIHERIDAMREQQTEARLAEVESDVVERSLALGDSIGDQLVDWIATDNYGPTRKMEYELPSGDSYWVATAENMRPLEPFWNQIRPFGLDYSGQCNQEMRMEFSTDPDSTFYAQAAEVMNTGDRLTEEQQTIARFWLDTPGVTGAPSGHWMMIATQVIEQYELTLDRAAEIYILLGTSLADAFISTWDKKYIDLLMRPVTYINANIRRGWQPYIQSPPFPEYPSGHSVASAAAAEVLTTMLGEVAFVDRTPIINGHENIERAFTSFEAAASEAGISRMYGGIHFRAAIERGLAQGRCVGQAILNNVRLRSIPQGE